MEYTEKERSFEILGVFLDELGDTSIQKLENVKNFDIEIIEKQLIKGCVKDSYIEEAVKELQGIFLSEKIILNIARITFGFKMLDLEFDGKAIDGCKFFNTLLNLDETELIIVSKLELVKITKESIYNINYDYNAREESIKLSANVTLGEDDDIELFREFNTLKKILLNKKEKDLKTIHNRIG